MGKKSKKLDTYSRRKKRVRKNISGTALRPRLSVFRSTRHIYAQIIDDTAGHTLVAASSRDKEALEHEAFKSKADAAFFVGGLLARRAKDKGVVKVVFDRNGFLYHGRVKAVSMGARKGGLEF